MLLACNKCPFTIEATDPDASKHFYPKYRNRPLINRSSWSTTCASCMKKYKREHYEQNKERINKKHRDQRYANHEHFLGVEASRRLKKRADPTALLYRRSLETLDPSARYVHDRCIQWKASAKRRKLEWALDESSVLQLLRKQDLKCFYTGTDLVLAPGSAATLSLDRLDPQRGYVPDNVVACGRRVNLMKIDMSPKEFRHQIEALLQRASIWCPPDQDPGTTATRPGSSRPRSRLGP